MQNQRQVAAEDAYSGRKSQGVSCAALAHTSRPVAICPDLLCIRSLIFLQSETVLSAGSAVSSVASTAFAFRRGAITSGPLKLNQRWHCPYFRRVMRFYLFKE